MGQAKIGAILALSGEQEYRRAISAVNSAQKELKSEMKLVTAEFSGQANTMEALTKKGENLGKQRELQTEKIKKYESAVKSAKEKEEKAGEALEKNEKIYLSAKEKLDKLKNSTEASAEEIEKQKEAVKDAAEKLELSERAYTEAEKKTSEWKTSLNNANVELKNIDREIEKTNKYLKEAEESADGTANSIDEFGKEIDQTKEKVEVFGGVLKANLASELIISGAKRIGSVVADISKYSLDSGKNFEESMSKVAATMGIANSEVADTTGNYKILQDAARSAGETTKYSATESAEALNYLALAGYDAQKAAKTLPGVLDLAAAGGMDLAYASDLATDSMAALNIASDEFIGFSDQMAVTSQKSNTSISQLGEAILSIGGTAKMLAGGTVELNTELGILADNGIKGAEGGIMLRNVLKNLTSPTADASAALKEYGISVYDAEGNMRPLNETLGDMENALSGLSDQERANVMNRIFDSRTLRGAEALIANCGSRFDELSGYISNADGAAKEMAETMSNNLSGEIKKLESVSESTGITLYSKFDQSFKNITRSASDALSKVNQQLLYGKLGSSMDHLANQFEATAEAALDFGEGALPVVVDGLGFILENGGEIVSVLTGIASGMVAFKAAAAVADCIEKFKEFKRGIEKTKSAMEALNLVTNANPYVLLASAIVGVGAALVTYAVVCSDAKNETEKLQQEIRETIKDNKEFNSSVTENLDSMKENRKAQEQSADTIKRLTTELTQLNSKEKLSSDEKQRMASLVAQLNNLMPDLNLSINEQTGYLNQTNAEVENLAENYAQLARAQYYQQEITEIIEQQCKAEEELTELMEKREDATVAITRAEEDLTEYLKEHNLTLEELCRLQSEGSKEGMEYTYAVSSSQAALQELDNQIEVTKGTLEILGEEYNETSERIGDHSTIDETTEAMGNMAAGAESAAGTLSEQTTEIESSFSSMSEKIRESVSSAIDIFSEYEQQTTISGKQIISNMESQVEGMKSWGDNLSELAGRADENGMLINEGLLSHLVDLGPEGAAYAQAFVEMTDDELKRANELWAESIELPDTIAEQFSESGEQMAAGLKQGIEDHKGTVEKALSDTVEGALKAGNRIAEIMSPSKKTTKTGMWLDEGLEKGIKAKKPAVVAAMKEVTTEVLTKASLELSNLAGQKIGMQFSAGLANGILAGESMIINAAVQVAKSAVISARKELDMHSPSRKTYAMGGDYMDGWILGIQAKTENLKDAVKGSLSKAMIQDADMTISERNRNNVLFHENNEGSIPGGIQIIFQPQQMTEDELDRAFDYVNERFGFAL